MSGLDVRAFAVGPIQENAYIVSVAGAKRALMVDPGEEAERLLQEARTLGVEIEAIIVTHCHFDHIGAVAEVARATGAPVYCPEIERGVLADIPSWTPPGFGPFDVIFTPGHSPGHVTYAIAAGASGDQASVEGGGEVGSAPAKERVLLSGDVLFQGSVGRVDLPGGDWNVLERSIGGLLRAYPPQTAVYPGHMGATTLGRERDTNPFLAELRVPAVRPSIEDRPAGEAGDLAARALRDPAAGS
jgi:hydroxyacylglutathione hydrolase